MCCHLKCCQFSQCEWVLCTSHQCFEQDCIKIIWALLLSMVDCDKVPVLVNTQSLGTQNKEQKTRKTF